MMKRKNTYSLSVALVLWLLLSLCGCQRAVGPGSEQPTTTASTGDDRRFDPLELPRDKENVPARHPRAGKIEGSALLADAKEEETSQVEQAIDLPLPEDTVQSQVYRVQLLTSKLYGDSRQSLQVAEEIFDQPVYIDYEVPYYKVRVGNFGTREEAEEYQMKAKAAGYSSCWVVVVNVGVQEAPSVYEDLIDMPISDSLPTDSVETDGGVE